MSAVLLWNRLPARWRTENALILAALALSMVFLVSFCSVVSSVVRSAEQRHVQPFGQAPGQTPEQAARAVTPDDSPS
ncbi:MULTISPECIES: hypothetical protein [unclassified Rhizobacter]|uniref:hypothetical protein n=1 Tax=unclassified Rhizobacter TaxID=2640088 RepID=UPI0006F1FD24|nr:MULTISPECIES: hypothetical protein [unclassified Rhizobacter]KQU67206.1 hypothetical protein ASC88_09370 [Rhizobacter sp. Root29]KQV98083.1 hypothetical protein ASC98_08695 [Rhizobacter sp. Root1238]KRB01981.1 hypothetical protein ASE08_16255 [Rhizobacter sp. Root16D2]